MLFLLLDRKIGDQETNEWLTALIDDDISNLKKKMEDYFPTSELSSAWIQQPIVAEMNGNEQLNLHEPHLFELTHLSDVVVISVPLCIELLF